MRRELPVDVVAYLFGPGGDAVLRAVGSCPARGAILPHTKQAECGCSELTHCAEGRGASGDGATFDECLLCRFEAGGGFGRSGPPNPS
jgi:hypothetical protein